MSKLWITNHALNILCYFTVMQKKLCFIVKHFTKKTWLFQYTVKPHISYISFGFSCHFRILQWTSKPINKEWAEIKYSNQKRESECERRTIMTVVSSLPRNDISFSLRFPDQSRHLIIHSPHLLLYNALFLFSTFILQLLFCRLKNELKIEEMDQQKGSIRLANHLTLQQVFAGGIATRDRVEKHRICAGNHFPPANGISKLFLVHIIPFCHTFASIRHWYSHKILTKNILQTSRTLRSHVDAFIHQPDTNTTLELIALIYANSGMPWELSDLFALRSIQITLPVAIVKV